MIENLVWRAKQAVYAVRNFGKPFSRECPICNFSGLFDPFGYPVRPEARCPRCKSLERHRTMYLWLSRNIAALKDKRVLHFAPERAVTSMLGELPSEYITADIAPGAADIVLDIEEIDLAASSYDVVICSHVLEHVNDATALKEIKRILSPDGMAILMVPVVYQWPTTFERDVETDAERIKYFGQWDHIRRYGADFPFRITKEGFELDTFQATPEECIQFSLGHGDIVYIAKPNR